MINETWEKIGNDTLCNKNNNLLIMTKIWVKNFLRFFSKKI